MFPIGAFRFSEHSYQPAGNSTVGCAWSGLHIVVVSAFGRTDGSVRLQADLVKSG
jgi:hypothetical protein